MKNTDTSKPDLNRPGETVTPCAESVSTEKEEENSVTGAPEANHKASLCEGPDAHPVSTTQTAQVVHTASTTQTAQNTPQTKASDQKTSQHPPYQSVDVEAMGGGGGGCPTPAEDGEKGSSEVKPESLHHHHHHHHHHSQEVGAGEETFHRPGGGGGGGGEEESSQGGDGGGPSGGVGLADPPVRKRVRRRMGMGRLGERDKRTPLDGQMCGRRGGGGGGGDGDEGEMERDRRSSLDGQMCGRRGGGGGDGEEGEMERETNRGMKVNEWHILAENEGAGPLGIAQSDAPLQHISKEAEHSGCRDDSHPGGREPAAVATDDGSGMILRSEEVTREGDRNSTDPSEVAKSEEQKRPIALLEGTNHMEMEVQQRSSLKDPNCAERKASSAPSAPTESANRSTDVGEASLGRHTDTQNTAVSVTTVARDNTPCGPQEVQEDGCCAVPEGLGHQTPRGLRTADWDSAGSRSRHTKPAGPTAPSTGHCSSSSSSSTFVSILGHDPEKATHGTADLCHDPVPFDPSSVNMVSDSQLNALIMEMDDQHVPECTRGAEDEDATELVCGLIRELSSLNRTIMAAHKELESLRRGNRTARTPQRRPFAPRRPDTQPLANSIPACPSVSLPGQ
ncbi:hypothetical protein ACEWY4_017215 [Coilia grayii]|uniref:Uncharacterized protein n=1 Tax=Coilia grayii TaxID=363190 RepID=A0ABD1JG74_9TELE